MSIAANRVDATTSMTSSSSDSSSTSASTTTDGVKLSLSSGTGSSHTNNTATIKVSDSKTLSGTHFSIKTSVTSTVLSIHEEPTTNASARIAQIEQQPQHILNNTSIYQIIRNQSLEDIVYNLQGYRHDRQGIESVVQCRDRRHHGSNHYIDRSSTMHICCYMQSKQHKLRDLSQQQQQAVQCDNDDAIFASNISSSFHSTGATTIEEMLYILDADDRDKTWTGYANNGFCMTNPNNPNETKIWKNLTNPTYYSTASHLRKDAVENLFASTISPIDRSCSVFSSAFFGKVSQSFLHWHLVFTVVKLLAGLFLLFAIVFSIDRTLDSLIWITLCLLTILVYCMCFYEVIYFVKTAPSNPPLIRLDWLQTGQHCLNYFLFPFIYISDRIGTNLSRMLRELLFGALTFSILICTIPPLPDFPYFITSNTSIVTEDTSIIDIVIYQFSDPGRMAFYVSYALIELFLIVYCAIVCAYFPKNRILMKYCFIRKSTGFDRFRNREQFCNGVELHREIRLFTIIQCEVMNILCPLFLMLFDISLHKFSLAICSILHAIFIVYLAATIVLCLFKFRLITFIWQCEPK